MRNPFSLIQDGQDVSEQSLTIAFVSDRVYPFFKGGGEKRYWEIATRLARMGHHVHFFTGQWPGMSSHCTIDGVELHGVYKVRNFYVNGRKSVIESLRFAAALVPALLAFDFDVVDCEQFPIFSVFSAKLACVAHRKPLVVTWHEAWSVESWLQYLGKAGVVGASLERHAARLADRLVSVSPYTSRRLVQMFGIAPTCITTIQNGIDHEFIDGCPPVEGSPDIVYAGRLVKHKGVDILLEALALMKQDLPGVTCTVIGDGPERERLVSLARSLGVQDNVRFLGFLEDDAAVYSTIKSAKVFVLPSSREGFAIVVPEANACGIPVIVVDHEDSAASELVTHGRNGFVCKRDAQSIAEYSLRVLREPASTFKSGCVAESLRFRWDQAGEQVQSVYRFVTASRRVSRRAWAANTRNAFDTAVANEISISTGQ